MYRPIERLIVVETIKKIGCQAKRFSRHIWKNENFQAYAHSASSMTTIFNSVFHFPVYEIQRFSGKNERDEIINNKGKFLQKCINWNLP